MEKIKLAHKLFDKSYNMEIAGVRDIKSYEFAFQSIIEKCYPGKYWWEITECNIFMHLLQHKDPEKTVIEILHKLKL